ncbi:MAG: permease [Planctomycetaceae bacterium]|nr:permease [Planctomycetaceae bacterium]
MIALIGGLVIGLCLGLLGSGGSILTVPLLVYLLGHDPKVAIGESLAIVGGIALLAAIRPVIRRDVDWTSVVFFGVPGILGTVMGVWGSRWISGPVQLLIFAVVMLVAAVIMFRGGDRSSDQAPRRDTNRDRGLLVLEGVFVGVLTGIVGVGGGFLIVPALVMLARLPMRTAVGTSLLIIAAKSGAGFLQAMSQSTETPGSIDFVVVGTFLLFGGLGGVLGGMIGTRLPQRRLRRLFAVFLLVAGAAIIAVEASAILSGPENDEQAASSNDAA